MEHKGIMSIPALCKYCEDFATYGSGDATRGWCNYFQQEIANDFSCQYFLPPKQYGRRNDIDNYHTQSLNIVDLFNDRKTKSPWEKSVKKWS